MDTQIIFVYCLCDDLLKALGHRKVGSCNTVTRGQRTPPRRCTSRRLTAGRGHETIDLPRSVVEVMAFRFEGHGSAQVGDEVHIADAGAQQRAQRSAVFLTETEQQGAIDGESHAIAGRAEVLREGGDEAEASVAPTEAIVARGAAARQKVRDQLEALFQSALDALQVERLAGCGLTGCAHRHGLDQPQGEAAFGTVGEDGVDLVVVHPAHDQGVDPNRREAGRLGGLDTAQNLIQVAPGDLLEDLGRRLSGLRLRRRTPA